MKASNDRVCTFESMKGTCNPRRYKGKWVADHIYRDLPPAPYQCVLCGRKQGERHKQ